MDKLQTKPFEIFHNDWALVTAGPINKHNSMTVSWGGMGTLWSKSVVTIYIKPCRFTYQFLKENDYFVVSFFDEEYKKALGIMGSKSGRDINKDELANLTPVEHGSLTLYKEAKISIICKKIYFDDLAIENIPQKEIDTYYTKEKPHRMYIGEVVEIIRK